MHSTADDEVEAEKRRDEEATRRRREDRYRRLASAGAYGSSAGAVILVCLAVYAVMGRESVNAELTGTLRAAAAVLLLGGGYTQLRNRASLRSEHRYAEQQRQWRLRQASIDGLHRQVAGLTAIVAQLVQGSPSGEVVTAQLAEMADRQQYAERRLIVVEERTGVAYTTGFADGATATG